MLHNVKKLSMLLLLHGLLCSAAQAQYGEYDSLTFVSPGGDSLHYRRLNPLMTVPGEKYPLILFLHGAGERGEDNVSQLYHGAMMFTNPVNRERYPAIVLFPQCPARFFWPMPERPDGFRRENPFPLDAEISAPLALVMELLESVIETAPVDTGRIYVTGLSMGGMGTFDLVCRFPRLFAAAVPICGGVHTGRFDGFASQTAFRIFHGDADAVVPVRFSREAYRKLKERGAEVEYIEFPGVNHDSWNPAFNRADFLPWLFQQRKK